jgi:Fe-S-cluster containining protein
MAENVHPPASTQEIAQEDSFTFDCHKGVSCFTECCRMLELALSPYDVLRLRHSTGKTSAELLDQYIIEEQEPGEPFPRFYLTMVDDGRASCVFVSKDGCTIYKDRPAACRTYPLGRAVQKQYDGTVKEHFILIKENHCQGFLQQTCQTPVEYTTDQDITIYNRFNDLIATILQHPSIQNGFIPSKKQVELYTLALYDLDSFRAKIVSGEFALSLGESCDIENDEQLLEIGIGWITTQLYSQFK